MYVRWIVVGLLFFACAFCAELPAELRHLTGLAASLPPEFQSDALLQIVEAHGGLDAGLKKDLLEQASAMARQAKSPYPRVAVHGISADSRQAFEANALGLKVDRLSLEMRAIRNLFAFDPIAARVAFQQVQKPAPASGTCRDALIPQLDDYFDIGAQAISRGFTPKELDREEHLALALQILAGVSAPHEVAPAARMIAAARLTPQQFEAALNAFTARLEAIVRDSRAFTETGPATQQEIAALAAHAGSLGLSRATLGRAYRKYLASHYAAPNCESGATAVTRLVEWFNESDLRGDLPVIDWKDFGGTDPDGKFKLDLFWLTPDSEQILTAARGLRTSPTGVAYSAQERASTEWSRKLQDFLAQLNEWKQTGEESSLDFFHQKATVYESLIDVCPAGDSRMRLMSAFVSFLKNSDSATSGPAEWFWHAQNMYRRLRQSGDGDAAKLMSVYKASGSLMLEVYAQFNPQ